MVKKRKKKRKEKEIFTMNYENKVHKKNLANYYNIMFLIISNASIFFVFSFVTGFPCKK